MSDPSTTAPDGPAPSINPEMIILARLSRGLTQIGLARHLNIGQPTLSRIEHGFTQPTPADLASLCTALDYPRTFFSRTWRLEGPGIHEMHHRKRKAVSTSLLNQVYARATIQREQVALLLQSSAGLDSEFHAFPIDEFDGAAERIARTIRAIWRMPLGPLGNVTDTIERAGGIVIIADFKTKKIDGMSVWSPQAGPIFWLNKDLPPDRWRWTLAHELGHIVMHMDGDARPEMEGEADRFAGELLMPAAEIKPHLTDLTLPRLAALKRQWKVSMQALIMRAYHLNVISKRRQQHMFMQISKAGYRMREPAQLDPPRELPSRIGDLLGFHRVDLGYSELEILEMLACNEGDLSTLASASRPVLRIVK